MTGGLEARETVCRPFRAEILRNLFQTFHVWLSSAGGFTAPETIRLKPDNYSVSHPRSKEGGSLPDPDLSLALIKKEWAHLVANGDRY